MATGKSSPILWSLLGVAGVLVAGMVGTLWWNEQMGLRSQGVDGARTQHGLRLVARHRDSKPQGMPHPLVRFFYDTFKIPWSTVALSNALEIDLPAAIPLMQNQAMPKNCSAVAVTPDGSRFALEIKPAVFPQRVAPPPQARGSVRAPTVPLTRTIAVTVPRGLPEGITHLDVTVTAPGASGTWRLTDFDTLKRQITPPVQAVAAVTIGGDALHAAAWTFPEGREEKVWAAPNTGQRMMTYRAGRMGNSFRPPFPNVVLTTQRRDPDVITIGVWKDTVRDLRPPPTARFTPGVGENPPISRNPFSYTPYQFNYAKVTAEWDDGVGGMNWRGSTSSSGRLPDSRYHSVQASLTRPGPPGFGGTQKWVKIEGNLDEYRQVVTTVVFRDIPVRKAGSNLEIAPDPAKASVQKDGWTVRLSPKISPNTSRFGNRYAAGSTGPLLQFQAGWSTKQPLGTGTMVEVLYREESGVWRTVLVGSVANGINSLGVGIPAPTGGKIRAVAVRLYSNRVVGTSPVSFLVPVQVGKPAGVPERLLEM